MLPTDAKARKEIPLATGLVDYFPDALIAVAKLSRVGNEQHNPGKPLHWDRSKSTDEADTLQRHFFQRGTVDTDDVRHSTKVAWRALALLQKELEATRNSSAKYDGVMAEMKATTERRVKQRRFADWFAPYRGRRAIGADRRKPGPIGPTIPRSISLGWVDLHDDKLVFEPCHDYDTRN